MPRRKQDAPRRLKCNTSNVTENSADDLKVSRMETVVVGDQTIDMKQEIRVKSMEKPSLRRKVISKVSRSISNQSSFETGSLDDDYLENVDTREECEENSCSTSISLLGTLAVAAISLDATSANANGKRFLKCRHSKAGTNLIVPMKVHVNPTSVVGRLTNTPKHSSLSAIPGSLNFSEIKTEFTKPKYAGEKDAGAAALFNLGAVKSDEFSKKAQLHLGKAMAQHKGVVYGGCEESGWVRAQRTDHNCITKSKAERYRWCVQKSIKKACRRSSTDSRTVVLGNASDDMKKSTQRSYPIQERMYSTLFTGADKFCCRDCGDTFNTLVDLTVHMSKTGHYRDQNIAASMRNKLAYANKRFTSDATEKRPEEKVLRCLGCGDSFDSLQDLSVHMIKTKHYEEVTSLRCCNRKHDIYEEGEEKLIYSRRPDAMPITDASKSEATPSHQRSVDSSKSESNTSDACLGQRCHGNFCCGLPDTHNLAAGGFPAYPDYAVPFTFPRQVGNFAPQVPVFAAADFFLSAPRLSQIQARNALFGPFLTVSPSVPTGIRAPLSHTADGRDEYTPTPTPVIKYSSTPTSRDTMQNNDNLHSSLKDGKSPFTAEQIELPLFSTRELYSEAKCPKVDQSSDAQRTTSVTYVGATSSPLEHLAKLANGNSLCWTKVLPTELCTVPSSCAKDNQSDSHPRWTPNQRGKCDSDSEMLLSAADISMKKNLQHASTTPDFIKSLECTIKSAIGKVNETAYSSLEARLSSPLRGRSPPKKAQNGNESSACHVAATVACHVNACKYNDSKYRTRTESQSERSSAPKADVHLRCQRIIVTRTDSCGESGGRKDAEAADARRNQMTVSEKKVFRSRPAAGSTSVRSDLCANDHDARQSGSSRSKHRYPDFISEPQRRPSPGTPPGLIAEVDPLNEIQKIVDSTSVHRICDTRASLPLVHDENRGVGHRDSDGLKKFTPNESAITCPSKRFKTSPVLDDLVHAGHSPPRVNPLTQMEYLVNLGICGDSLTCKKSSHSVRSVNGVPRISSVVATKSMQIVDGGEGVDPMSGLLRLAKETEGAFTITYSSSNQCPRQTSFRHRGGSSKRNKQSNHNKCRRMTLKDSPLSDKHARAGSRTPRVHDANLRISCSKTTETLFSTLPSFLRGQNRSRSSKIDETKSWRGALRPEQEIKLQFHCVMNLDRLQRGSGFSDLECNNLSKVLGLQPSFVKNWIASTKKLLDERKDCNFISLRYGSDQCCFRCIFCNDFSLVPSASSFLRHLSTHPEFQVDRLLPGGEDDIADNSEADHDERNPGTVNLPLAKLQKLESSLPKTKKTNSLCHKTTLL